MPLCDLLQSFGVRSPSVLHNRRLGHCRLEAEQRVSHFDRVAHGHLYLGDDPGRAGQDDMLHLHHFEHGQGLPGNDARSNFDRNAGDPGGHRGDEVHLPMLRQQKEGAARKGHPLSSG